MTISTLAALITSDWLIEPAAHALFVADATNELKALFAGQAEPRDFAAVASADKPNPNLPKMIVAGGVATIPISGVMMRRPSDEDLRRGAAPTEYITGLVRDAHARADVRAVILHFDTPGGQVSGTAELADAVFALSSAKPTVSFTDGLLASAGYWVASQTGVIIATPSATIGSIGVYGALIDMKGLFDKFGLKMEVFRNDAADLKTIGLPGTSITDPQRAYMQERMEEIFAEFSGAVTSMRPDVKPATMRGQTFTSKQGIQTGLIDKIGTMADARKVIGY